MGLDPLPGTVGRQLRSKNTPVSGGRLTPARRSTTLPWTGLSGEQAMKLHDQPETDSLAIELKAGLGAETCEGVPLDRTMLPTTTKAAS
jgi:hypothetical protein